MRGLLVALVSILLLAGCSDSTSSQTSPTTETASKTRPSSATTPSPTPIVAEPTVDFVGESLVGLPDCDWKELGIKLDFSQQIHTPEGEKTNMRENAFGAPNSTGHKCVVRDVPKVTLFDSSGQVMWPVFPKIQPYEDLPWVLRDGLAIQFYFQIPDDLFSLCPQTAEKVETVRFAFSDGTVINYPVRKDTCPGRADDCVWACANDPTLPEINMRMRLVQ
ncbi:hypothetical protein [Trueperella pyogenes]|uniref:hypothetical protein n=1 Tax=Trueperella pyogenes TaxID=1661 RepID=UPI00345DED3D